MKFFFFSKPYFLFFLLFFFTIKTIFSQSPWATSVYSHQFGLGQTLGQDYDYFPYNVLGAVNQNVSATTPAALPEDIVSLGKNGWVALGFDAPIINGAGADFTVFENAFEITGGLGIFDEWLIVSVSNDGVNWFTFPYDSLTGEGMAGRTPTQGGNVNYLDPSQSGGDSFDIGELGLSQIQYVRVQDATRLQSSDRLSSELDAIIALHQKTTAIELMPSLYDIYTAEHQLFVQTEIPLQLEFFNLAGQSLQTIKVEPTNQFTFPLENWVGGMYFLRVNEEGVYKFCL